MTLQSKKYFFTGIGFFFVALGTVGIFLPLLPTTPFLLIALWAFAKSSKRFHTWLLHHRLLGRFVQDWEKYGIVPIRAKILAILTMTASATWVIFGTDVSWIGIVSMTALMAVGAGYLLSRPHKKPPTSDPSN